MPMVKIKACEKCDEDIDDLLLWGRDKYNDDWKQLVIQIIRENNPELSLIRADQLATIRFERRKTYGETRIHYNVDCDNDMGLAFYFYSLKDHDSSYKIKPYDQVSKMAIDTLYKMANDKATELTGTHIENPEAFTSSGFRVNKILIRKSQAAIQQELDQLAREYNALTEQYESLNCPHIVEYPEHRLNKKEKRTKKVCQDINKDRKKIYDKHEKLKKKAKRVQIDLPSLEEAILKLK